MVSLGERRISQAELSYRAKSVKTYDNEIYKLQGSIAVNEENGDIKKVADIYYRVRTAVDEEKQVIAKRKKSTDELGKS